MSTVGNVETDLISQFSQAGINQTLHRIYLNVSCKVTILTPFDSIEQEITNQVLIAEAVILGDVPATYYNLNGVKSDDLMELIEWKRPYYICSGVVYIFVAKIEILYYYKTVISKKRRVIYEKQK